MAGSTGIENSYLVQGLETNEMRLFLKCFREESYSAGSYIFKENDDGNLIMIPYHAIASIAFDIEAPVKRAKKRRKR